MAKIIERGWAGHFICAHKCMFRRNTLIVGDKDSVIVSTVGGMRPTDGRNGVEEIGYKRYYETMVFGVKKDGEYLEADVQDQRDFDGEWSICADSWQDLPKDVDNRANEMHEKIVAKFANEI